MLFLALLNVKGSTLPASNGPFIQKCSFLFFFKAAAAPALKSSLRLQISNTAQFFFSARYARLKIRTFSFFFSKLASPAFQIRHFLSFFSTSPLQTSLSHSKGSSLSRSCLLSPPVEEGKPSLQGPLSEEEEAFKASPPPKREPCRAPPPQRGTDAYSTVPLWGREKATP